MWKKLNGKILAHKFWNNVKSLETQVLKEQNKPIIAKDGQWCFSDGKLFICFDNPEQAYTECYKLRRAAILNLYATLMKPLAEDNLKILKQVKVGKTIESAKSFLKVLKKVKRNSDIQEILLTMRNDTLQQLI